MQMIGFSFWFKNIEDKHFPFCSVYDIAVSGIFGLESSAFYSKGFENCQSVLISVEISIQRLKLIALCLIRHRHFVLFLDS